MVVRSRVGLEVFQNKRQAADGCAVFEIGGGEALLPLERVPAGESQVPFAGRLQEETGCLKMPQTVHNCQRYHDPNHDEDRRSTLGCKKIAQRNHLLTIHVCWPHCYQQ